MPIVDITPVGSKSYDPQKKVIPVYLVIVEDITSKNKIRKFLAVRLDEMPNFVKIVGVETNCSLNMIAENYQEMVNSIDKKLYKEVMLPWQRIVTIQNLIFKQK